VDVGNVVSINRKPLTEISAKQSVFEQMDVALVDFTAG
jgi:hypothetical protein